LKHRNRVVEEKIRLHTAHTPSTLVEKLYCGESSRLY